MATIDRSPRAPLVWLVILSLAGASSCSKSDPGPPGAVPDASTPIPDAAGSATDANDAPTAADVSVDESLDVEHDAAVEPVTDSADGLLRDMATESADGESDGASDAFDGGSDDAVADTPSDTADATADADANPCGVMASQANVPRRSAPAPSSQLECTAHKPCPPMHECIGGGCDDIWQCIQHVEGEHPCSTDPADYCGCDGVTFTAVHVCPDRPYQRTGACEDGVSCDPTMLRCSEPEPPCPEGQVPSVVDGRYGRCTPIHFCRCQFVWECPHREKYRCDTVNTRCTTLPVDP